MRNLAGTRHSLPTLRSLTIIAQDPALTIGGAILRAQVKIPAERLLPGPCGYRVHVIDYDASTGTLYEQAILPSGLSEDAPDPFAHASDDELLGNPRFHAQNVYAIVMRTLARFEFALGRRVPWGCDGHQLHIAPHGFADPNAFYSREDRGLFFGYFGDPTVPDGPPVFTCLSHDVVAHETTHAILDGLRSRFLDPSSPDQAAFHEGFADVVALLSVFALPDVVAAVLGGEPTDKLIDAELLTKEALCETALFGLADQMGSALAGIRGEALRRSINIMPGTHYLGDPEWEEPHRRGELVVAAMLEAFLQIWVQRLARIGTIVPGKKDRSLVVEEGARAADHLLTMAIRAIDYCPPVDLSFADYLSALLTVDREVVPDDRYGYRQALVGAFGAFGMAPSRSADHDGSWLRCNLDLIYSRTHFDSLLRDEEEVFRFVWENREALGLGDHGYIEVQSVRPSIRIAPDGFVLRETIAEYVQILTATAEELRTAFKIKLPREIPAYRRLRILGGGTLIFDEYGQLKYQIANHLLRGPHDVERQGERLSYLWRNGELETNVPASARIAAMHLARGTGAGR